MPCSSGFSEEEIVAMATKDIKERLDRVTQYLCKTCKILEENNLISKAPQDIKDWWCNHKAWDEKNK